MILHFFGFSKRPKIRLFLVLDSQKKTIVIDEFESKMNDNDQPGPVCDRLVQVQVVIQCCVEFVDNNSLFLHVMNSQKHMFGTFEKSGETQIVIHVFTGVL